MKRIAINGFGRIGRLTFRNLLKKEHIEIVAINDLTDNKTLAHLLKYDSAHGRFDGKVDYNDESITVNGHRIKVYQERNPENLPWQSLNIDTVLECTGYFRTRDGASKHLSAGAQRVLISAPPKSDDIKTVVLGVNEQIIETSDKIISNASCTTNCFAPIVKTINDTYGIESGHMTTTHSYTGNQMLVDGPNTDLRRARAGAINIVPTSTGAGIATEAVIPEVKGKIDAFSIRVPVITGSLIEFNCTINKKCTAEEVNALFKSASENHLKGILYYETDAIVSTDIISNTHSSIYDSQLTLVRGNNLRIVSWYDNEMGYSSRLADLTEIF